MSIQVKYLSVAEKAKEWGVTDRAVRKYCADGKIPGAVLEGKTWRVPADAALPGRKNARAADNKLLCALKAEMEAKIRGGIYHKVQVLLTFNSNHIEGSTLTEDQTRRIFETSTIGDADSINVNDIVETTNHFKCIDYCIKNAKKPLSESIMKTLHLMLKTGAIDEKLDYMVGDYKLKPNEVGGQETTPPKEVPKAMQELVAWYGSIKQKTFLDIIDFHYRFEKIHPFQDGNGRVGRLIMFKECLAHNIVPFIIEEDKRWFYYRGLKEWTNQQGFLMDTCLAAQDKFKKYLEYFELM